MEPIATLHLIQVNPGGKRTLVRVEIGEPRYDERGSWVCPVLITSIDEEVREIHGEDSLQALCLAVRFVGSMLGSVIERGCRLLYEGEGAEEADFPLNAYFGVGEPLRAGEPPLSLPI
jgi:hypothetical protein